MEIAIVATVAVGVLLGCNGAGGSIADLQVGDCFDQPADATTNREVQPRACGEPHDAEVIVATSHPATPGAAYPTNDELRSFMSSTCVSGFADYTGATYDPQSNFDFGLFYPLEESWRSGDRDVTCYVFKVDRTKLTESLHNAGPSSTTGS